MKLALFSLVILTYSMSFSIFAQNIYTIRNSNDTVVYLGSHTNSNDYYIERSEHRVLLNHEVVYVASDSLLPINELNASNFLQLMKSNDLIFVFEDWEPFWKIEIEEENFCFTNYDESTIEANLCFDFSDIYNGFVVTFYSEDFRIYGVISNGMDCVYEINERTEHAEYKIIVSIDEEVYTNCGVIDKK